MLDSPLSPDECLNALKKQTATFWGTPVLRNLIPGGEGTLLRARHKFVNNAFQTLAAVKLQPGGHGSLVEVTLRSSYFVSGFMTLWLGFAILFNLLIVANGHLQDLALTLIFPVFGFGFIALGRLLCLGDRSSLLDFIRVVLSAE